VLFFKKEIENFIKNENISISMNNDIQERNNSIFNKRNELFNTCKSLLDCDINQICYMNKCYDNISDQVCIEDPEDIITHRGNCTNPYYCEKGKCKNRISYNDECSEKLEYQCYETQDDHKPRCRNDKCQIKSEEDINFITSEMGLFFVAGFILFLIIVFFTVFYCATKYNKNHSDVINEQLNSNTIESSYINMLNPSLERNLYLRSLKESINQLSQNDATYKKNAVLNKFKANEPYLTVNTKKDFDTTGNNCPKSPQSASTLINKSFSSTSNFIDRKRTSQRSSILNSSYRHNSSLGISSPNENIYYNISFQDFNTSNSFTYLSPSDSRNLIQQLNTVNSTTTTTTPSTLHQSFSFSSKKHAPIDSPILPLNIRNHDDSIVTSSTPYILEEVDENNEDNQTTLSFDDGILKMSNKDSSISFSSKENKDI
jgi:hypothetical protein